MDRLGNLLTSIRNAEAVNHSTVTVPHAKQSLAVLEVLKKAEYVTDFKVEGDIKKTIVITLTGEKHSYKRISTPGRRLYTPAKDIKPVLRGYGMVVISTSKGVMTGKEAFKQNLGGELICQVS